MPDIREYDEKDIQRLIKKAQADPRRFRGHSASALVTGDDWDGPILTGIEPNRKVDRLKREDHWDPGTQSTTTKAAFEDPGIIRRRTPQERLESMSLKIWKTAQENPQMMERLLKRVQGLKWQEGQPVTMEQVRAVAETFLNKAEKEA
jgi:hypothetical protein